MRLIVIRSLASWYGVSVGHVHMHASDHHHTMRRQTASWKGVPHAMGRLFVMSSSTDGVFALGGKAACGRGDDVEITPRIATHSERRRARGVPEGHGTPGGRGDCTMTQPAAHTRWRDGCGRHVPLPGHTDG